VLTRGAARLAYRRAVRAGGLESLWRRRSPPALPPGLRERLLAIPASAAAPRLAITPDRAAPASMWLLASPWSPMAAAALLVTVLGLCVNDPYSVGAATVAEARADVVPAAARVAHGARRLIDGACGLGEAAIEALPRAGVGASRAISRVVSAGFGDPEPRHAAP